LANYKQDKKELRVNEKLTADERWFAGNDG